MTEDYLNDYREAKKEEQRLIERIDQLKSSMYSVSGISLEPSYGGSGQDRVTILIDLKEELMMKLVEKQIALTEAEIKIEEAVETLPKPEQKRAIKSYYISGIPGIKIPRWQDVADYMGYSLRQTQRIKSEALLNLLEYAT